MKKITLIALSIAALASCTKEMTSPVAPSEGQTVNLTINVNAPGTKTAFDYSDTSLVWTGGETMRLIFGRAGAGGVDNANNPTLSSVSDGVFSGTIQVPDTLKMSDLQGFVIPGTGDARFDWVSATDCRMILTVPAEQTQQKAGEPNWDYVPFFYDLVGTELVQAADGSYSFAESLTLKSYADFLRFNIYGKHPSMSDDEVIKSVKVTAVTYDNVDKVIVSGNIGWVLGKTGTGLNSSGNNYVKVTLAEGVTTADKTKETGVKVFAGIVFGGTRYIGKVEVETNKRVYTKLFETPKKFLQKSVNDFNVFPVNIDMSTTFSFAANGLQYSTDNAVWTDAIPETFTTLYVKDGDETLTYSALFSIMNAIANQESSVALDLSAATYESTVFPAVFKSSSLLPFTKLKSIKFPSNVTEVAESAFYYCTGLESVDLTTIATINNEAFRYSGLKSVNVGQNVTKIGTYIFADCYDMTEIYWNCGDPVLAYFGSTGTKKRLDAYTFAFVSGSKSNHTNELVATIGPDTRLARYMFAYNANLTKIILEYNGTEDVRHGSHFVRYCRYLTTVESKGTTGRVYTTGGSYWNELSDDVPAATLKQWIVPDGCKDLYSVSTGNNTEFYKAFVTDNGFKLVEKSQAVE